MTMPEPIISVSGLRGIVGESLTPAVAARYVRAFLAVCKPGRIVVTRDSRESGPELAQAIAEVVLAAGREGWDGGIVATPTTGVLIRQLDAAGGIQVSASHNPAQYNGLKLFSSEGRVMTAAAGGEVLEHYRRGGLSHESSGAAAQSDRQPQTIEDPLAEHLRLVLATVDVDRIRAKQFRVLVDANHGAGGALARRLLEALACQITLLGEEAHGRFAHVPEPTAENLTSVLGQVVASGAAVGFCQDPDADRLAVVDEQGRYLGEEYTLAMCVDHVLRSVPGAVVTNCSTSRMTEDLATRYRVPFVRSAVGEANVVDAMQTYDAAIGGEGNGGVIDPRVGMVRDSFVGMALILDAMAARDLPVSRLAGELPRYEIEKTKIACPPERLPAGLAALEGHFSDARIDRLDGLRMDWPGAWLLVRASNTEPIVRAIAEAPTRKEARRLCEESARVLGSGAG